MKDIKVLVVFNCYREHVGFFHGCEVFFKRDSSYFRYVKQFDTHQEIELSINEDLQKMFIDSFLKDSQSGDEYDIWTCERYLIRQWLDIKRLKGGYHYDLNSYCHKYLRDNHLFNE